MNEIRKGIGFEEDDSIYYIDCSNLVHQSYKKADYNYEYKNTQGLKKSGKFTPISKEEAEKGDVMLFGSHMSLYDPDPPKDGHTAYGATIIKGVRYGDPSWFDKEKEPKYFRYIP